MISLSWNEIKIRANKFVQEWAGAHREEAEAQEFQRQFLEIFGKSRRKVAIYENRVKCDDGGNGYIDMFWPGVVAIEMKTTGKDLAPAKEQIMRYMAALPEVELPRLVICCDFAHWEVYNMDEHATCTRFALEELPDHLDLFAYLAGYEKRVYREQDPVNIQAAEMMAQLHDKMAATGYCGHELEVYLVRLLFCLFADDTGIFEKDDFYEFLTKHTREDGGDLGARMVEVFHVLNYPEEKRLTTRDELLRGLPYINGGLFAEMLSPAAFDGEMRQLLIDCCKLDWGKISPAIFGSMFQGVMDPVSRRCLGAHYTSEQNILKLIHPLFLDALRAEFEAAKALKSTARKTKLQKFHEKLGGLTFLDPACGCGNFLVICFRELRQLELEVIDELYGDESQMVLDVGQYIKVGVEQFYGIEIEEFPAQIAQVAMWLMDHQMNLLVGSRYGQVVRHIPLRQSATIRCTNALTLDWAELVPPSELKYILGTPPFVGARIMSKEQKADLMAVFKGVKNAGNLDFVACWYRKAANYIQGTEIEVGLASPNSIF